MRIERCYFCSSKVYPGHGMMFVRNDSKVFRFCRTKCRRLFNRKKNPRKAKWTKAFRKSAGKELAVDPTFDLEKKRNIPIKYNRELWAKTMEAMKSIVEIRERRENKFVMDRLVKDFKNKKMQYRHLVRDHLNLVRSPAAGLRRGNVVIDEEDLEQDVMKRIIAEVSKKKPKRQLNKEELAKEEDMSEDEKIEEDDDDDEIDTDSDDNEDGGDDEEGEEDDEDGEGEAGGEEEEDSGSDVEMSSDEEEQE